MSVASRVAEAVRHLIEKDYESAMIAVCVALDATAGREFPQFATISGAGKRCTAFMNKNLDIITAVGFGGAICSAPGSTLNLKTPGSSNRLEALEKIIYKTLRCTLLHEASLPEKVVFTEDAFYGERDGHFYIPVPMIYALLLAVIGASSNSGCQIPGDLRIRIRGKDLAVNELWGKADDIRKHLGISPSQDVR
ncbi:hypothetical protein [Thermogutta sp.]|uniref:hypothetical protein n=1 Tax=Thermogutta sp. TaxID=1962930 RepID=UPI003C7C7480